MLRERSFFLCFQLTDIKETVFTGAVIFESTDKFIYFNCRSAGYEECFALNSTPDHMPVGRFPEYALEGAVTSKLCH